MRRPVSVIELKNVAPRQFRVVPDSPVASWCVFVADARRETRERCSIHRLPARPDEAGASVRILLPAQSAGGQWAVGYIEVHLLRYVT